MTNTTASPVLEATVTVVWNDGSGLLTIQGTPLCCGFPGCSAVPRSHSHATIVEARALRSRMSHQFSVYACGDHGYILPSWVRGLLNDEVSRYLERLEQYALAGHRILGGVINQRELTNA